MNQYERWGIVLIGVAVLTFVLQLRRWRRRALTTPQFLVGLVPRAAFLALGIAFLTGLVERYPRLPLITLTAAAAGIIASLVMTLHQTHKR